MSFLKKGYQIPKSENNYFEFEAGTNRFRVLSSEALTGWQYWTDPSGNVISAPVKGCQVVYVQSLSELPKDVLENPDLRFKHLWLFALLNRKTENIQICKLTQSSIMHGMEGYLNSEEWGDPTAYDFIVTRQGDGLATKYTVMVGPKESVNEGVVALYREMAIDLTRVFRGEDPLGLDEKQQVQPQPKANGVVHEPVQANGVAAR